MKDYADFLRALAERVYTGRLSKAEQVGTLEQFFAQL